MNFAEAVEFLEKFPDMERARKGPLMTLDTMRQLLDRLGNPQTWRNTIHITGSKGKGSTATLITSMLKQAGYSTALFTSPHLHSYRERIAFGLDPVDEANFAAGASLLASVISDSPDLAKANYSTFGLMTALYFVLAQERKVDWRIVEVGMGGRDDATNVFYEKALAVFTPISLEHTAILGNSATEIAENKAGIITDGCTVVMSHQHHDGVSDVIRAVSKEHAAEFVDVGAGYQAQHVGNAEGHQRFTISHGGASTDLDLQMLGLHQIENALTAIAAIDALRLPGLTFGSDAIAKGLASVKLSGRFEILKTHDHTVILDGAHNRDSAKALLDALKNYAEGTPLVFVLAVNADKDVHGIWHELQQASHKVIVTRSSSARSLPTEDLASKIKEIDPAAEISVAGDFLSALSLAVSKYPQTTICVTGSLYLVADIRATLTLQEIFSYSVGGLPS